MKKLYLLSFALFTTSQQLHSGGFRTSVYVAKEAIKTVCCATLCYCGIASSYHFYTKNDFNDTMNMYMFVAGGTGIGIHTAENLATYYEQFQDWRAKKSALNSPSIPTNA